MCEKSNIESLKSIYKDFWNNGSPDKVIRHNVNQLIEEVFNQINGFKIPYYIFPIEHSAWDHIQNYKIIHLIRKNRFEAFVSMKIVNNTAIYQIEKNKQPISDIPFEINIMDFMWYSDFIEKRINHFLNKYQNSLVIYYEDLCRNWDECIFRIEEFLEIQKTKLPILYQKRIRVPLKNLITNYNYIKSVLNRYANYLT